MINKLLLKKYSSAIFIAGFIVFFTFSFVRGSILVKRSEKELNTKKVSSEAHANAYILKEVDTKTGDLRWKLTAEEGSTENDLQNASIKGIKAEVYKNNEIVFKLSAPLAKADHNKKEIFLLGEVTAENDTGDFFLKTNQLALGMGTSIEAQKGFNLTLKNSGTISGEEALVNDDQTEIVVKDLKEASFKNISLSGNEVHIEKEKGGDLKNAKITNGGKVLLKNDKKETLTANTINWKKGGEVEAIGNVVYTSTDKVFRAGYLLLKEDGKVYAKNSVQIVHGEVKCSGSSLSFEDDALIVISGRPKAVQGANQITADKIVYNLHTGKVEASGNVKTSSSHKV